MFVPMINADTLKSSSDPQQPTAELIKKKPLLYQISFVPYDFKTSFSPLTLCIGLPECLFLCSAQEGHEGCIQIIVQIPPAPKLCCFFPLAGRWDRQAWDRFVLLQDSNFIQCHTGQIRALSFPLISTLFPPVGTVIQLILQPWANFLPFNQKSMSTRCASVVQETALGAHTFFALLSWLVS